MVILCGYFLGALPMGYFVVKLLKNRDITKVGSGRTGGTNAMRAGGVLAGVLTGLLDWGKGFAAFWLARTVLPGAYWIHALAGAAAVLGHNWSILLYILTKRVSAGAGTGPNIGAATASWPWIVLIALPVIAFCVFIVGYASVASIAAALILVASFVYLAASHVMPWAYAVFSMITAVLVIVALLPNIDRLIKGTERRVGLFAPRPEG
jgi:glycerol-3-phosphate acyltransferase PlsY